MSNGKPIQFLCMVLAAALVLIAGQPASAEMVKKVDNFVILLDQSGSMAQRLDGAEQTKIKQAVALASRLDQAIPELDYTGSMYLGSPYKVVSPPAAYRTGPLAAAAQGVNTRLEVFGRNTSLGDDLVAIGPVIDAANGRTALIMLTDGDNNEGVDPVASAGALYARNNPDLCIHVISYADTPHGKMVIDQIRAISGCSVAVNAADLASEEALARYVRDVFYQDAQVVATAKPGDSDRDGVLDDRDKCPNTEYGVLVDADGCALKYTLDIEFDFDKADIRPEYHNQIAAAAAFVRRYPQTKILIAGHTDSVGEADYNKALSMRRAAALKTYLVEKFGIDAGQLFPRGYGEQRPVASNDNDAGRQENRRVEFICCTLIPPEE